MVQHILNRSELQKAVRSRLEDTLAGGYIELASYNRCCCRWEADQGAITGLRGQVRDYLLDYLTDLLEELLDYCMDPDELIGEFYDWDPEPEARRAKRSGPAWMYDDDAADMEYCRRRDEGLL